MAKKNFQTAPKPEQKLSHEAIEAFEKNGVGKDKNPQNHKPSNVVNSEPLKRLSIDLPASIHLRFKTACSATNNKMTREMERLIVQRTQELEEEAGIIHK